MIRSSFLLLACLVTALAGCARQRDPALQADLLIRGATVIDPGSGSISADTDIAIAGGRIVALGKSAAGYEAARQIDAQGQFIVPAFTDMHSHWGNGTLEGSERLVELTLARNLYYGVTRILNMGASQSTPGEIDTYRARLADGTWQGPQIFAAGALLTVPGSHPTTTIFPPPIQRDIADIIARAPATGPIDLAPRHAITLLRSPQDAREEVSRLAAWGADAIKITIESGPGPFGEDHPQMPQDVIAAVVAQARQAGIPVIAHISARDDLEACLQNGVTGAAHAIITGPFDAGLHQRMGAAGFFYVTTIGLYDGMVNWSIAPSRLDDPFLRETLSDQEAESLRSVAPFFENERRYFGTAGLQTVLDHVRDAQREGAILLSGTDTGNPLVFPGYGVHQELAHMVRAGVSPMQALASTSANAARFFGQQGEWGSIAPGQSADLLILEADPLADITNTRRIAQVIQRGMLVDRASLPVH